MGWTGRLVVGQFGQRAHASCQTHPKPWRLSWAARPRGPALPYGTEPGLPRYPSSSTRVFRGWPPVTVGVVVAGCGPRRRPLRPTRTLLHQTFIYIVERVFGDPVQLRRGAVALMGSRAEGNNVCVRLAIGLKWEAWRGGWQTASWTNLESRPKSGTNRKTEIYLPFYFLFKCRPRRWTPGAGRWRLGW